MAIVVIEEGAPNGTDLVLNEARFNPVAQANAVPQRMVPVMPLGDGYVALGVTLEPAITPDGDSFAVVLSFVGGRESSLVPTKPVKIVLGELARIPLVQLKERLANVIDGKAEEAS